MVDLGNVWPVKQGYGENEDAPLFEPPIIKALKKEQFNKHVESIPEQEQFEHFIRAFWRRVEPYKNDYGKELPEKLPVEFRASMETALMQLTR